jgi:branched-chain amino acid transport system permease protein
MTRPVATVAALVVCAATVLAIPVLLSPYTLRVMDLAIISAIAVVGLCFAFGYAGLVHLGQGAFVGVGAYGAALLTTRLGLGFWTAMPLALVIGAAFAILIGAPLLRLRGHYLALATVGFNETVEIVAKNWTSLTGGDDGVSGIPGIGLFSLSFNTDRSFYYLALAFLVFAALIGTALRASRFGRAMVAVRDDELACGACGVTAFRAKLLAFTLASIYGALSGVLYAHYSGYIAPSDFDVVRSITLLVMLIVGGEASIIGAIGGAILVSYAPEWLRFLGQAYLTFFGIAIILVLILLPDGAAGALLALRRRAMQQRA